MAILWSERSLHGRALTLCLALPALIASPGSKAKPNFSGVWKLNFQRSGPIMPRGLEAMTLVIDHRGVKIYSSETRTVAGKVIKESSSEVIDGMEHISHPRPGVTLKQRDWWPGNVLMSHWEQHNPEGTYAADTKQTLSPDGIVLTQAEHYWEPGLDRVRDWIFEKQ